MMAIAFDIPMKVSGPARMTHLQRRARGRLEQRCGKRGLDEDTRRLNQAIVSRGRSQLATQRRAVAIEAKVRRARETRGTVQSQDESRTKLNVDIVFRGKAELARQRRVSALRAKAERARGIRFDPSEKGHMMRFARPVRRSRSAPIPIRRKRGCAKKDSRFGNVVALRRDSIFPQEKMTEDFGMALGNVVVIPRERLSSTVTGTQEKIEPQASPDSAFSWVLSYMGLGSPLGKAALKD